MHRTPLLLLPLSLALAACTATPVPTARPAPGMVASGNHHSLVLHGGRVYAAGEDKYGQRGQGTAGAEVNAAFAAVPGLPQITRVYASSGGNHNLALGADGAAYGWGWNNLGQVGVGTRGSNVYTPQKLGVPALRGAALGTGHTLAAGQDGRVYAWGRNTLGQLGTGDTAERLTPTPLPGLEGVREVASGINHGVALTRGGEVYTWGSNSYGQIGNGARATGTSGAVPTPFKVPLPAPARAVAAGNHNTFAILEGGELYAWGDNTLGLLGDGTTEHRPAPTRIGAVQGAALIDSGARHTLALLEDGRVLAWGDNEVGQLGNGASGDGQGRLTPQAVALPGPAADLSVGTNHNLIRLRDGRTLGFGSNGQGRLAQPAGTALVTLPTTLGVTP